MELAPPAAAASVELALAPSSVAGLDEDSGRRFGRRSTMAIATAASSAIAPLVSHRTRVVAVSTRSQSNAVSMRLASRLEGSSLRGRLEQRRVEDARAEPSFSDEGVIEAFGAGAKLIGLRQTSDSDQGRFGAIRIGLTEVLRVSEIALGHVSALLEFRQSREHGVVCFCHLLELAVAFGFLALVEETADHGASKLVVLEEELARRTLQFQSRRARLPTTSSYASRSCQSATSPIKATACRAASRT
ncbi:MAG: hypothetical protein QM784_16610 [Polyangiaceae bacterium]